MAGSGLRWRICDPAAAFSSPREISSMRSASSAAILHTMASAKNRAGLQKADGRLAWKLHLGISLLSRIVCLYIDIYLYIYIYIHISIHIMAHVFCWWRIEEYLEHNSIHLFTWNNLPQPFRRPSHVRFAHCEFQWPICHRWSVWIPSGNLTQLWKIINFEWNNSP